MQIGQLIAEKAASDTPFVSLEFFPPAAEEQLPAFYETVEALRAQVEWIAPVTVYPGEDEMQALAQGGIRVLKGEEEAKVY